MRRLRELRQEGGLTQAQLASRVGTTQQTIARWEAGLSTPSIINLGKLARELETTVSDLLREDKTSKSLDAEIREDDDLPLWGHIGVRLSTWKKSSWFPISAAARSRAWSDLRNSSEAGKSFSVTTLNNRIVILFPSNIQRILMLDDDADWPEDEKPSSMNFDAYSGMSNKQYKIMDKIVSRGYGIFDDEEDSSEIESISSLLAPLGLNDPDKLFEFLHNTVIFFTNGDVKSVFLEPQPLAELIIDIELSYYSNLYFDFPNTGLDFFVSKNNVSLIIAPLIDFQDGEKELTKEADL